MITLVIIVRRWDRKEEVMRRRRRLMMITVVNKEEEEPLSCPHKETKLQAQLSPAPFHLSVPGPDLGRRGGAEGDPGQVGNLTGRPGRDQTSK